MVDEGGKELANLATKLTQLEFAVGRSETLLSAGKRVSIKRHLQALQTTANEANECRRLAEAEKIAKKEEVSEIKEWNSNLDLKLDAADVAIEKLEKFLADAEKAERFETHEEELKRERSLHENRMKMQAELSATSNNSSDAKEPSSSLTKTAKLPKLVISRFGGSFTDWPKFWGHFTEAIDKSSIAAITKFTYLLELLEPNVKRSVESLPFTPEGYTRAKTILQTKYGKETEIEKCFVREILDLPNISGSDCHKIKEFCEKLTHSVQALETMGKLGNIRGNVSMTLDKLSGIRGDLVRNDPEWETWDFVKLVEALNQWIRRNPAMSVQREREDLKRKKLFSAQNDTSRPRGCVYCGDLNHKAVQCEKITDSSERKRILARKGLCFNCATKQHRAAECTSKSACGNCHQRHHTSICDRKNENKNDKHSSGEKKLMTTGTSGEGIFPVVVIKVNGITCRALIDSGAGSSYASANLISTLKIKPSEIMRQQIDMLMTSRTTNIELYDVKISSSDGSNEMSARLNKIEKGELLFVNNPQYGELIKRYSHLNSVRMIDTDTKSQLPIHVILGSGDYARIKTPTKPLIGQDAEPVAELTKFGWTILSPGVEFDRKKMMLTQTSQADFDKLCRLDVLGLADRAENDQLPVYEEFQEQLERSPEGWYETGLPWKANHPPLPTNETGSRRRLESLLKRLRSSDRYSDYNDIITQQLKDGVIEQAPKGTSDKEFYIPHKAVVKNTAESTKLRVVYDASAKESRTSPSLNDCLNPGPCLQNLLWSILIRSRFLPILLTGDLEKAFLQVRIKEAERDALRFHWKAPGSNDTVIYRFTRALFGLTCSPFLLNGVLSVHLKSWESKRPELVKEIRKNLYVDDLMTGGATVTEVKEKKIQASKIFEDATFKLHKWHSNVKELESPSNNDEEITFAKQELGDKKQQTKLLGLPWDKSKDSLSVTLEQEEHSTTKRTVLSQLAKIYDPLGLVSPMTLQGKNIFRETCEARLPWDGELPQTIKQRGEEWCASLPSQYEVPRSLAPHQEPVSAVTLHAFGDASKVGVSAVVYAVVEQAHGTTQGLVCSKSRLAKRNLSIPRLELVAGHMAVNLLTNVEKEIDQSVVSSVHCWSDSTVALYWINGKGDYRQFVANRVAKIQSHTRVEWHHVPTKQNPADVGSRGGSVLENNLWSDGPEWLKDPTKWPPKQVLEATREVEEEKRTTKNLQALTTIEQPVISDVFEELLGKFPLRKVLRICVWINRFVKSCRVSSDNRKTGPLTSGEVEDSELWWIKRTQKEAKKDPEFEDIQLQLNIQSNESGVLECRGRIEGDYPMYLPRESIFTKKVIERAHLATLHGGVAMTMAKVRERFWVPKLRRLVKQVRKACYGCVRIRARAFEKPPPGKLPATRTQGSTPFQVIGVDFAGPIRYQTKGKAEKKAYLVLYGCSLTRAVHLEILRSMEVVEFIPSLKRLIARRGRPKIVYSDNAKTFKAADKWLKTAQKDEKLHQFLADNGLEWRFNLSRAPWWGGQFERLIGLFKRAFYKTIGNGILSFEELAEVVLDVEVALNNRPLTYLEDDVQLPVLTPWSMLNINPSVIPEVDAHHLDDRDLRKKAKFLRKCKEAMWNRWSQEYIRSLRERHNQRSGKQIAYPKIGEVVIIRDEDKKRNEWKLGVVSGVIEGKDNVIRGVRVRTSKGNLERAVQHIYPLELSCDEPKWKPNPEAKTFAPRPTRDAAAAAKLRVQQDAEAQDN